MTIEPFGPGFLHTPAEPANKGIVLTHGAGGNCQAPLLIAVANAFAQAGYHALRCNLAFRQKRPSGPPHPSLAAADREGLRENVASLRGVVSGAILLGGHSYGGRQATMLASEDPSVAGALVLLSYPLHPPGRPEQLRTAHFGALKVPCLFVHGTKDDFGTIEEMTAALKLIPASTGLSIIDKAGHDLQRGKFDITSLVVERVPAPVPHKP